jgi:uncharacterized protein
MILTDSLLLDYKRCPRRAFLNLDESKYEARHKQTEKAFLTKLRQESATQVEVILKNFYPEAQELQTKKQDIFDRARETEYLMKQGAEYIHNGVLVGKKQETGLTLQGNPHLLVKTIGNSRWGDWKYTPISIHLGRRPKPEYKLISSFYAYLLEKIQYSLPIQAELILRDQKRYKVNLVDWLPRLEKVVEGYTEALSSQVEPELFISRQNCSLCHWHGHCYSLAKEQQHLSLVPGVTPSRYKFLQSRGISTLDALVESPITLFETVLSYQAIKTLRLQAQSLLERKAIIKSNYFHPRLAKSTWEIYFDIEAEPEINLEYLLGILLVNSHTKEEKYHALLAVEPQQEARIWQEFLEITEQYSLAPIFHYSEYEVEAIKKLAYRYNTSSSRLQSLLERTVDLHHHVIKSVTMPVESYSLKSLANWLGFYWRDSGVSGEQCVCWYDQWLKTGQKDLLDSIIRYNEDDCRATYHLKDWLLGFLSSAQ